MYRIKNLLRSKFLMNTWILHVVPLILHELVEDKYCIETYLKFDEIRRYFI